MQCVQCVRVRVAARSTPESGARLYLGDTMAARPLFAAEACSCYMACLHLAVSMAF